MNMHLHLKHFLFHLKLQLTLTYVLGNLLGFQTKTFIPTALMLAHNQLFLYVVKSN